MTGTDTYIFAGGGSGGHLFPGIAVADELRRRNPQARIEFVGSERPVEQRILQPTGYVHHALPVRTLPELRRSPVKACWNNWAALRAARRILIAAQPRWVIGLGGFASVPTVWLARRLGIPVLLLEQNVIPGAATRWLAGCAQQICMSFEETRGRLPRRAPTVITGNPVRTEILRAAACRSDKSTNTDDSLKTLMFLGGSQGAVSLNEAVTRVLGRCRDLLTGWRIVHQVGPGQIAEIRESYASLGLTAVVEDYFPQVAELYAAADIVISRAGATTLAELACVGCPALLIPYPFAADQHQAANAEVFARRGAALMITQGPTAADTAGRLQEPLEHLLRDPQRRDDMRQAARRLARPQAAQDIVNLLLGDAAEFSARRDRAETTIPAPQLLHSQEFVQ